MTYTPHLPVSITPAQVTGTAVITTDERLPLSASQLVGMMATTVYTDVDGAGANGAMLLFVHGNDGTASFAEVVLVIKTGPSSAVGVVGAPITNGAPAARTYAVTIGGDVTLTMASGIYSVRARALKTTI